MKERVSDFDIVAGVEWERWRFSVLCCTILHCTIPYYTVLRCAVPYRTALCYRIANQTTVPARTTPHRITLHQPTPPQLSHQIQPKKPRKKCIKPSQAMTIRPNFPHASVKKSNKSSFVPGRSLHPPSSASHPLRVDTEPLEPLPLFRGTGYGELGGGGGGWREGSWRGARGVII